MVLRARFVASCVACAAAFAACSGDDTNAPDAAPDASDDAPDEADASLPLPPVPAIQNLGLTDPYLAAWVTMDVAHAAWNFYPG